MEVAEILKHKNKIFNLLLLVLTAMIAFNLIYKKQSAEIGTVEARKETEIKKNKLLGQIGQSEKKINAYKELLGKKNSGAVIKAINDMARESDLKIVSIRPGQEQVFPEYIKFPYDLTVNSDNYHDLGKFISKLESFKDVYVIDAMNIASGIGEKGLTVTLKISSIAFTN